MNYQDYIDDYNHSSRRHGTAGIPGQDDDRKLFVGGLGGRTTDRELRHYFSKFGEIESVTVKTDPLTGRSRGFAFIVFTNPNTIEKLLYCDHYIDRRRVDPKPVSTRYRSAKIFVGGLTPEISNGDIRKYFSQYGTVLQIQAPINRKNNERKPFCFITFSSRAVAHELLKVPRQYINGRAVNIRKVKLNSEIWGTPFTRKPNNRGNRGPNSTFNSFSCVKYTSDFNSQFDILDDYDDEVFNGVSNEFRGKGYKSSVKTWGNNHYYHRLHPY